MKQRAGTMKNIHKIDNSLGRLCEAKRERA